MEKREEMSREGAHRVKESVESNPERQRMSEHMKIDKR